MTQGQICDICGKARGIPEGCQGHGVSQASAPPAGSVPSKAPTGEITWRGPDASAQGQIQAIRGQQSPLDGGNETSMWQAVQVPPKPAAPAPQPTPSQDWKSQLDAIPAPGSGAQMPQPTPQPQPAAQDWKSQLDSIPTPGQGQPAAPPMGLAEVRKETQMLSVPPAARSAQPPQAPAQPQLSAPQPSAPQPSAQPDWRSQLDAIPTPGSGGQMPQQPNLPQLQPQPQAPEQDWKSQLDSIPTPGSGLGGRAAAPAAPQATTPPAAPMQSAPATPAGEADWKAQLDNIPTPGAGGAMRPQPQMASGGSPLAPAPAASTPRPDPPEWKGQLDAIPTPRVGGGAMPTLSPPAGGEDWRNQLDSIGTAPRGGASAARGPSAGMARARGMEDSNPGSMVMGIVLFVFIIALLVLGGMYLFGPKAPAPGSTTSPSSTLALPNTTS